jgi:hypothetical protein
LRSPCSPPRDWQHRPSALAHGHEPDAQIFATNNTAVITDPADPRLGDPLRGFAREVERVIAKGGGSPRGSQLLDGVFFSSDLGTTTFERSREFDVDHVADDELHAIADTIRARFDQESVLTFDNLRPGDDEINAVELEVPGVSAQALRDGLLADQTAREELFGGSVTQDGHLLLVAELADAQLARDFAAKIGGDLGRAQTRYGESEFVEGPAPGPHRGPHAGARRHARCGRSSSAHAVRPHHRRTRRRAVRLRGRALRPHPRGPR